MSPALYRQYIRDVLALAAPYAVADKALQDGVDSLIPGPIDLSAYREALEWNLSKDYIRSRVNADTDQREWRLTELGTAKQQQG
jgi:hypothetical protein